MTSRLVKVSTLTPGDRFQLTKRGPVFMVTDITSRDDTVSGNRFTLSARSIAGSVGITIVYSYASKDMIDVLPRPYTFVWKETQ